MKFGVMFSNVGLMIEGERAAHMAQKAEEVGFESLFAVEHVVIPEGYKSTYPYNEKGRMPGPEDSAVADPFVWLGFAAAVTKTIQLGTGVMILPIRHPFHTAKIVATIDQLSGGRAFIGIGVGWLEEEFEAMDIPFNERGNRTNESLEALRSLWADGSSTYDGEFYKWSNAHSHPKPLHHIPIHIGGHTMAAAKRAARYGDGFFPAKTNNLPELIKIIREECDHIGRDFSEIEITAGRVDMGSGEMATLDEVKHLMDMGVSRFVTPLPGFGKEKISERFENFAESIISKF